ncbi:prolyl oligopeptidase family serine peptidase [Rhizobium sp.]|uniref:alpha/beta hydrolase n=1 Tax=Rhizobium sp. TaxID=391 RepID=UPI0028AAE594
MITLPISSLSSVLCLMTSLAILTFAGKSEGSMDTRRTSIAQGGQTGRAVAAEANVRRAERPSRLVIFFHGIRSRGSVMAAIGNKWASVLPDTEFISPDAPFENSSRGREWFIVDDQVLRPDRVEAARRAFDNLVSRIVREQGFENDLKNVAFVGVSQGAIVALDAVTSGRWKVGALVSFAGLLPLPPTSASRDTPIMLMHGGADTRIPSAASVAAQSQLKAAGYDVTYKLFPTVGHTISSEEAEQAATFLKERWAVDRSSD